MSEKLEGRLLKIMASNHLRLHFLYCNQSFSLSIKINPIQREASKLLVTFNVSKLGYFYKYCLM